MLPTNSFHRIILLAIGILLSVLAVLLFITPSAIFPDPSWGFRVLQSMQAGSGFNIITSPDQDDIALNYGQFLSWWSPGQYLLPYLFKILFGLNLGQAAGLTTIFCQFTGLAGFYILFKKIGFSKLISALSLVFIICQQAFFMPYIFYTGGESLLFSYLGWFLYGCVAIDKPGVKLVAFVLLSGWIGFLCKSSFLWMYGAGLLFIWIRICGRQQPIKTWLVKGVWIAIPAVISLVTIYFLYLSKGKSPATETIGLALKWETFTFPLASPLLSGFSVDDLANGLILHNDVVIFSYAWAIVIIVLMAALSLLLVAAIRRQVPNSDYRLLLTIFYIVSILFFSYAYLRQMNISYESRHFRVIGLLIVPGTLFIFSHIKPPYKWAFGCVVLFIGGMSIAYYATAYQVLKDECARGTSGISQQFIDQPSLDYITQLDKLHHNAIFVFTSVDLALEIKQNRVITLNALTPELKINFEEDYLHKGHAGPIYILLPSSYIGIRATMYLKSFPGYKGFSLKELSDDYVLYFADKAR
jgi:hypothetical protein